MLLIFYIVCLFSLFFTIELNVSFNFLSMRTIEQLFSLFITLFKMWYTKCSFFLFCFFVNNEKKKIKLQHLHTLCFILLAWSLASSTSLNNFLIYIVTLQRFSNIFIYTLLYFSSLWRLIVFHKNQLNYWYICVIIGGVINFGTKK